MTRHMLRLRVIRGGYKGRLTLTCSCDPDIDLIPPGLGDAITLGYLNELAHEHIEAAERAYPVEPADMSDVGSYRPYGVLPPI